MDLTRFGLEWALSSSRLTVSSAEHPMIDRSFIVYYRVSTPKQSRSGLGLEAQRAAVERFVAKNRGKILAEYTEIESGKSCERPKLLEALGATRVFGTTLLIASLDRLARNVAFIAMLIETGVDFIAVDFPLANSFNKHTLAAIAEHELKAMSDRRKAVCAVLKARGVNIARHLEGHRPHRPGDLDAARATLLRREAARAVALAPLLRELREAGKSIHGIASELTRMEIEPRRGGRSWWSQPVRRLFVVAGEELPPRRGARGTLARKVEIRTARRK